MSTELFKNRRNTLTQQCNDIQPANYASYLIEIDSYAIFFDQVAKQRYISLRHQIWEEYLHCGIPPHIIDDALKRNNVILLTEIVCVLLSHNNKVIPSAPQITLPGVFSSPPSLYTSSIETLNKEYDDIQNSLNNYLPKYSSYQLPSFLPNTL